MKFLYLNTRFYLALLLTFILFVTGFFVSVFFYAAIVFLLMILAFVTIETFMLFHTKEGISMERIVPERLSNGDKNEIVLKIKNNYPFQISAEIIDELPFQFQERNFLLTTDFLKHSHQSLSYFVIPKQRGVYNFGITNVYASTLIKLVSKRYKLSENENITVYPSFLNLRKYELLASKTALLPNGIKRTRKIGQSSEFEQIKEYVLGDDLRHVNWKASAKKQHLMVNHYQEEKAQNVYLLIDKGRTMKMPFDGMTLLDYSINAALMLANISVKRQDKAGLWTFEKKTDVFLKADNKPLQIRRIVDALYHITTNFKESNYEYVLTDSLKKIQKRSLLILFTNFETLDAMNRQLPYLRALAKKHVLLVIIFENTLLNEVHSKKINSTKDIYIQTIASKFVYEKQLIIQQLQIHGIKTVYTKPADLSVNLLNKYLEIKRQEII
ncbi:Uncharacterized conserved protein, DUF58 family, contains vWF domain [Paenimyroides aquimaris]|uniref:Uncharacterized conserved protein, DUF58 family, contains vWF domain n=1 Tax=Paenimyroides marinum TaxID=1159016 RepID=A0A1H6JWN1_9FLAO|nr:DUF58 domain-containing protein [Paenimyroides aquimaris]SEH65041.1 Uncharacterized conserved protein, DUF58 family, contains vWF domain [Paenimyroides aquimaris]